MARPSLEQERMLKKSIQQYRRMVETTQDGVLVFNGDNVLVFANQRLAEMLGYAVDELVGTPLASLLVSDDSHTTVDQLARYRFGIAEEKQLTFRKRDDTILWALVVSSPLFNADGSYSGTRARVIDITALKRAEAELDELKEQMQRRDSTLEHKVQERTLQIEEFVATVSHEFRTPLTSVRGYLDLVLSDGNLHNEQERYLNRVLANVQHLTALLNNLLDLSRINSGNVNLDMKPLILLDFVQQVQDALRPQFESKGVELRLELNEELYQGLALVSDRDCLTRILSNLLSNACNYTAERGLVKLKAGQQEDHVWFVVEDNGMGIPVGEQARIFSKFFRGGNSRRLPTKGTGLGLAITKSLVDLLNGRITFTSNEGEGTAFLVTFPVA